MTGLFTREYGSGTRWVIVLHGGPAAAGEVAPLARELGTAFHVLEPFQRGSSDQPLTVATHVQDLDQLIRERCGPERPVLVGHSWGAMLALAYAAEHPATPAGLALIGCGTFSSAARAEFEARLHSRLTAADRASIARIEATDTNPDRRHAALGALMARVYGHDLDELPDLSIAVDEVAHQQTWADMLRLQREGTYPAAFGAIGCAVLMLHGEADPHPGRLTAADLRTYIPHLRYEELTHCGHSPWLERRARRAFFTTLDAWIASTLSPA